MRRGWRKVDEALFAAVINGSDRTRYHLIAERLPSGSGWDWTVWRPGDAPEAARHGIAPTAAAAMRAAEAAVRDWDDSNAPCPSAGS
jgi:RNA:NAD 2'-phosphotransferase (TPT1/KptA family)